MKYALESLPELIGQQQFRDLCIALGFDQNRTADPTGEEVASAVRRKANLFTQKSLEEERLLSAGFEQRLRQVIAAPNEPVPASEVQPVPQASAGDTRHHRQS